MSLPQIFFGWRPQEPLIKSSWEVSVFFPTTLSSREAGVAQEAQVTDLTALFQGQSGQESTWDGLEKTNPALA